MHFEELTSFHAELHGQDRPAEVFKEHGDMLRRIYRGDTSGLEASYFIDKIINWAHQVDGSSPAPFENANVITSRSLPTSRVSFGRGGRTLARRSSTHTCRREQ